MKEEDIHEYHIDILRKMFKRNIIGKNHKGINVILEGFPRHHRKELKKALEHLCKRGYVTPIPHKHGTKYSLNPRKISEIKSILDRHS